MIDLGALTSFDWDEGTRDKNWLEHQVAASECEEVFFNLPLLLSPDPAHSKQEARSYMLGQTAAGRRLFIAFTVRTGRVRIISARDMSKKERAIYATANS
jgi:uncharacterized DUF497 family protein